MNEHQRIHLIRSALNKKKLMFDLISRPELHNYQKSYSPVDAKIMLILSFPKDIGPDELDGYKLKGGKGFVSINEKFTLNPDKSILPVAYTYRFITNEYLYSCEARIQGLFDKKDFNYKFRYDKDLLHASVENPLIHPAEHIQVLHDHPRFNVPGGVSLEIFLDIVEAACFKDGVPYTEPIYQLG